RMRVDGDLQETMQLSKSVHSAVITRIKIMGKMNIAEKRLPQDGRVEMRVEGKEVDLRLSVLPTVHGEKMVIRLLDRSSFLLSKSQLGFLDKNLEKFNRILQVPNGIVLVTGPTGSGKSTTLYASLYELNQIKKNIITVEDPVEYQLAGINQVQVNNKAGLTFATSLRSILRQDPDIIMIGEMRDTETAQIAVRAAITGHLVLSTIHTNDTASTITRLIDMGLEPYLVSSSVSGIVAQRLVKKICTHCKTEWMLEEKEKKQLGLNPSEPVVLFRGRGCNVCNQTGYKGRIAIHEVMEMTKEIRHLVDSKSSIEKIREKAIEQGMIPLQENCKQLVFQGITTIEEMTRVTWDFE
ncbi:MAG: type II/IV secretion system protein, partial [Epulopiscium sp.]|nr:type II/IV secretion system protein [Candidatus Epulonipiscium sp.]